MISLDRGNKLAPADYFSRAIQLDILAEELALIGSEPFGKACVELSLWHDNFLARS